MAFIRLVLGLLFVVNAPRDYSYAHAHQEEWEMDKDKLVVREDIMSSQKELVDAFTTTSTRKLGFGGRKMVAHEGLMRRKFEKEQSTIQEGASEDISGEQNHASVKPLQESQDQYLNLNDHKKNMSNLKRKTQKSDSWGSPRSEPVHLPNTNAKHFYQDSKKLPTNASLENLSRSDKLLSHQPQATVPKSETQRLLEATKEIVNLMARDYKGMARRKPPINNHVPIH
ncbi:hypothetical protein P3X46_029627 [Hevea brasiliensis]|uniref:Uncharacterized protein n=2 Tax=Hevea brasiliensis TaxID=3981 RepID=A0ABQ9KVX1_HEVBR|nr:hypothetical protein P3X46_029627 [Hevea brasiliensis]